MKKTILLVSVLCFGIGASYAQINEGRVQVGGSTSLNHQKDDENAPGQNHTSTSFYILPSIGMFYKTNRLAGVFLHFGYADTHEYEGTHPISRTYGGDLYFRQYKPVLNKLYIYLEETGGYTYTSSTNDGPEPHFYSIGASMATGMAYDIAKKMQLEISLNNLVYAYYQNGSGTEAYGISTSLEKNTFSNIGFGFRYYLK